MIRYSKETSARLRYEAAEMRRITKWEKTLAKRLASRPMLEARVKIMVKKRLRELGCYSFWPVQTGMGTRTIDCLGCYRGVFFGIETKAPGKKPTLHQQIILDNILAAGGVALVIDNVEKARRLFDGTDSTKNCGAR